jgi:hypothetical protein
MVIDDFSVSPEAGTATVTCETVAGLAEGRSRLLLFDRDERQQGNPANN